MRPGQTRALRGRYEPAATESNEATVVIGSNEADEPRGSVVLSGQGVEDYLRVDPPTGQAWSGHPGGPFSPGTGVYTLSNAGPVAVEWSGGSTQTWTTVGPTSGVLSAGAVGAVTVSVNAAANALGEGVYLDQVSFSNVTTGLGTARGVALTVFTSSELVVNPTNLLVVTNLPGMVAERELVVSNGVAADGTLDFVISTRETSRAVSRPAGGGEEVERDFTRIAQGVPYVAGELLVRFECGQADWAPELDRAGGGQVVWACKLVHGLCLVKLPAELSVERALATYNALPGVPYA